ncbi:hypothetical protein BEL04_14690 [Mucilaginibacter sp. PPCGB 2223]|uniref:hypothetical protein n=1 Tax=Mucilaginibacter sp. PPCGB 2223 TaxID=1886027 RepID=UPI00082623A1|nr:hypothetical protein [Mucilaginibacter sp. PPCGB 2223]OCX52690.1 hypothetical protein BEL04_14690 [Mucilaginibacter sp. PPCGB 2223]
MSDYVVYFSVLALLGILYAQAYKRYVFTPKIQRLDRVRQFRYARNLNTELINLLWQDAARLEYAGLAFNGATFDDTLDALQNLRDNLYTTQNFKQLAGKQKAGRAHVEALQQNISKQIQMQQQIRADYHKLLDRFNRMAA